MALKAGRVGVYPQDLDSTGHIRQSEAPDPYTLPIASESVLGGVKPVNKTNDMTQNVGVNAEGELFTIPSNGTEIYYADFDMTIYENYISTNTSVNKEGYTPIGCAIISRYTGYSAYGSLYHWSPSSIRVYGNFIQRSASDDGFIARVYYMRGTPTQLT